MTTRSSKSLASTPRARKKSTSTSTKRSVRSSKVVSRSRKATSATSRSRSRKNIVEPEIITADEIMKTIVEKVDDTSAAVTDVKTVRPSRSKSNSKPKSRSKAPKLSKSKLAKPASRLTRSYESMREFYTQFSRECDNESKQLAEDFEVAMNSLKAWNMIKENITCLYVNSRYVTSGDILNLIDECVIKSDFSFNS